MNLQDRSAAPIHVGRDGRSFVRLHPPNEISLGRESFAAGKNRAQTMASAPGKFFEKAVHVAIDIAQERQIKRIGWSRSSTIGANVIERAVVQDDQPREMQRVEFSEGDQRVAGVHLPGPVVHGIEQSRQLFVARGIDRRQDHEVRLRSHGADQGKTSSPVGS